MKASSSKPQCHTKALEEFQYIFPSIILPTANCSKNLSELLEVWNDSIFRELSKGSPNQSNMKSISQSTTWRSLLMVRNLGFRKIWLKWKKPQCSAERQQIRQYLSQWAKLYGRITLIYILTVYGGGNKKKTSIVEKEGVQDIFSLSD